MKNKYGFIPTKEYPLTCLDDDCGAQAYHLSTINDHAISAVSQDGTQMREKTIVVRCRRGHVTKSVKRYTSNVYVVAKLVAAK